MKKSVFRLSVAIDVTALTLIGASLMALVLGLFLHRDLRQILPFLGVFVPVVLCLALVLFLCVWISLRKAEAIITRIDAGEAVSLADRIVARQAFSRLATIIISGDAIAFLIGPILEIALHSWVLKLPQDSTVNVLTIILGFAFGLSCASQQIARAEIKLLPERRKLAITDLVSIRKEMSVTTRILVSTLASLFIAAVSMGIGGIGMYREYARWVAGSGSASDATSSASVSGESASAATADIRSYRAAEMRVLLNLGGLALALILWGGLASIWTVRFLFEQVGILAERMREIQGGASDLTARATIAFNDEIGGLTTDFNGVVGALQTLFGTVKGLSKAVAESSRSLDGSARAAESSLLSFEEASASVRTAVEAQGRSVSSGDSVIARMAVSMENVSREVETQAAFVEQSSASIEEMVANIASVTRSAERADELTMTLSGRTGEGLRVVQDTLRGMAEIQEASAEVETIIGSIAKIASQSNLLAMNAAIEAAHAGDAGRGFSVVADEVRSLAVTSATSSREIIGLVKAMNRKIASGAETTGKAGEAFRDIASGVKDASELVQGIARSMAEQSQGAQEILSSVKELIDATERIKSLSGEQREQSGIVQAAIAEIARSAEKIEETIREQAGASQALSRINAAIFSEAEKNKAAAESLDTRIGGFRL